MKTIALALFLCWFASTPVQAEGFLAVMVFAAASTTNTVTDIGELYAEKKLGRVTTAFAASSTLAKQIEQGAPADILSHANPARI